MSPISSGSSSSGSSGTGRFKVGVFAGTGGPSEVVGEAAFSAAAAAAAVGSGVRNAS